MKRLISLRRSADKKAALLVHRAACIFLVMLQQAIFATAYRRFLYTIFTPFQRFILPFAAGKCNPDLLRSPLCATMIRGSCGKRKRVFRRGGGRGVILPAIVLGLPHPQARKNGERRAAPRFPYFAAFSASIAEEVVVEVLPVVGHLAVAAIAAAAVIAVIAAALGSILL